MMALLYTLYFRMLEFLTGLSVTVWEFRAYCLDFPPIWICDGCGFAFRTMRGAQWHERGHRQPYCLAETLGTVGSGNAVKSVKKSEYDNNPGGVVIP